MQPMLAVVRPTSLVATWCLDSSMPRASSSGRDCRANRESFEEACPSPQSVRFGPPPTGRLCCRRDAAVVVAQPEWDENVPDLIGSCPLREARTLLDSPPGLAVDS